MNKIGWTEQTWNSIIGCTKISEGCKRCYAERMAGRLASMAIAKSEPSALDYYVDALDYSLYKWNGKAQFVEPSLTKPFKWMKPRMIFVCSMGDLFHETVKIDWLAQVFAVMFLNPQHTFQVLTKRPDNALVVLESLRFKELLHKYCDQFHDKYIRPLKQYFYEEILSELPLKNVWVGVTAENQEQADKRIPVLLQIPAKVRFVSCEPLLEEIKLSTWGYNYLEGWAVLPSCCGYGLRNNNVCCGNPDPEQYHTDKLDWVIAGPETGPGARPMQKEWIESLYQQCKDANVAFYDKKDVLGLNLKQFPK